MIGGEAKLMCFFFNVFYKPYRGISIPVLYRPTAHRTAIINLLYSVIKQLYLNH